MAYEGTVFKGLGKALRLLRDKRGRSQKEVAAAAGVTPPMLSAYENERTSPEMETLDKILDLGLQASLADLTWALDVVNDRLPHRAASLAGSPAGPLRAVEPGSPLTPQLATLLSPGAAALPPALEEGYAEIVRGLVKISRAVFESIARTPAGEDGDE